MEGNRKGECGGKSERIGYKRKWRGGEQSRVGIEALVAQATAIERGRQEGLSSRKKNGKDARERLGGLHVARFTSNAAVPESSLRWGLAVRLKNGHCRGAHLGRPGCEPGRKGFDIGGERERMTRVDW